MSKHFFRALSRDFYNRLKYGPMAPQYGERIDVPARECLEYLPSSLLYRTFSTRLRQGSGLVVHRWPDEGVKPVIEHPKVRYCYRHWVDGESWQQAGAYDYLMERISGSQSGRFDGCSNLSDVKQRYERLDRIFESISASGQLLAQGQLTPGNFREVGGVQIHLGPGGQPVFSGAGAHRFAMARILDLVIPAQIGVVHQDALSTLQQFRHG
ncbi:hypothetical protein [Marinobacter nauticus]|uniref:hypothetical protein n=1 Tax=Marinobacter nauticus TaxID=2743 RepID=UPI001F44F61C|nr:hypothetical protein [Marinobacter nauticus]